MPNQGIRRPGTRGGNEPGRMGTDAHGEEERGGAAAGRAARPVDGVRPAVRGATAALGGAAGRGAYGGGLPAKGAGRATGGVSRPLLASGGALRRARALRPSPA